MKSTTAVRMVLSDFDPNELILASKLYKDKLVSLISEAAFYKTLERLSKSGELFKLAKGTYYIPKDGKYGPIPPSEKEIIVAFTANETGVEIGYALYNRLNLTTQIPKTRTILSSSVDGFTKTIRNIGIKKTPLRFTDPVKDMIRNMDVLQNYYKIQDLNHNAFFQFTRIFASHFNDKVFEEVYEVMEYPKSTIAFAAEILDYYQVENNLRSHLSTLSTYKYPTMEELYETTRI